MKCISCENVELIPTRDLTISYLETVVQCPKCNQKYIENIQTGELTKMELDIDEYEDEYYDSGNIRSYIDNFIEEFTINNIKEREDTYGVEDVSYNKIVDYVRETINENDLIREELENISGTVTRLIEEYEELQDEKDNLYVTVGELIDKLSVYDRNLPLIIQKDSEGNSFSPLSDIEAEFMYNPITDWYGEKCSKSDYENAIDVVFLKPVN